MNFCFASICSFILLAGSVLEAAILSSKLRTDGTQLRETFGEAAEEVAKACTVRIFSGADFIGLGTVLSKDGIVVAKNSEIDTANPDSLKIVGPGKRMGRPRVLARDMENDLVFLDIGHQVDPGFEWGKTESLTHGTWVLAGVPEGSTFGVRGGVCSALTREIKKAGGVIGVGLQGRSGKKFGGVEVSKVYKDSPAEKAGVKKNDVIYAINGKEMFETVKMIEIVKSNDPGTTITVSIKRGDEVLDIEITLGYRNLVFSDPELRSRNDKMSGKMSVRRTGFKRVIQHEIHLSTLDMGGPLFDLEGKLIGINIAKANRVEFYAIPAEEIQKILKEKAGEIAEARGEN